MRSPFRSRPIAGMTAVLTALAGGIGWVSAADAATTTCVGVRVAAGTDIQRVIDAHPAGTTYCLGAGVHRLSAPIRPKQGDVVWGTGFGATTGTTLDGSRVVTGWTASGASWYATGALPPAYAGEGTCEDNVANPCRLRERVFHDDRFLQRVLSREAVRPGTFFADYAANRIYVGNNPAGHRVEVSRTPHAVRGSASGVFLRNVRVRRFASPAQRGAVLVEGPRWRVYKVLAERNHGAGIMFARAPGSVISSSVMQDNGQIGLLAWKSNDLRAYRVTLARNNTDGFWIADWESGGFKVSYSDRTMWQRIVADSNKGIGMWADISNRDTTFRYSTSRNNAADGIRFEISYGGDISRNSVTGNGFGIGRIGGGNSYNLYQTAGITVNTSNDVAVHDNTVTDNRNGIGLQQRNRGTGLYGTYELRNVHVFNNTVTQRAGSRAGEGVTGLAQNVGQPVYFTGKGNRFTGNRYLLDSLSAPRFAWQGRYVAWPTWRSAGQDAGGSATGG